MSTMLTYVLVALGMIYIVTGAALTRPVRVFVQTLSPLLGTLLSCPPCAGFWLGFGLWPLYKPLWQNAFEAGLATCGLGAVWAAVQSLAGMYDAPQPPPLQEDEYP